MIAILDALPDARPASAANIITMEPALAPGRAHQDGIQVQSAGAPASEHVAVVRNPAA